MPQPFLITGMPRSRTAWFAVACTTAAGICHHEPGRGEFDDAKHLLVNGDGISDSRLGLHLPRILDEIGPRTLVIDRNPDAVMASFARYSDTALAKVRGFAKPRLARLRDALVVDHPLVKRVDLAALDDIDTVRECMDWLGVEPLNLEQLMHMNIQSDWAHNLRRLQGAA